MAQRSKRLEQAKPKGDTPVKAWKRKEPAPDANRKPKGGGTENLTRGTIKQNRAKPGMTSPQ